MKYKIFMPIIGVIALTIGLLIARPTGYSQGGLPYPDINAKGGPSRCTKVVANEMTLMKIGWQENLRTIVEQEQPASESVDEAFESMRTYRCWLDYLCETVLHSANVSGVPLDGKYVDPKTGEEVDDVKFITQFIAQRSGCVVPDEVVIPTTTLRFHSECLVSSNATQGTSDYFKNFTSCRKLVNGDFSEINTGDSKNKVAVKDFMTNSNAYQEVVRALKAESATKKNQALSKKLSSLLIKLYGMESHIVLLKEQMFKFDNRLECYAGKCS